MKIYHLERRLVEGVEPRRASAEPEADNFYDFDDGGPDRKGINTTNSDFEDNNPLVQALRKELNSMRAKNDHLTEDNHHLTDTVDDLREKNIADSDTAEDRVAGLHAQIQTLTNQAEDLQSEKMTLEIELAQLRESLQTTLEENESRQRSKTATLARCDGLRIQLDATASVLAQITEENRNALQKVSEKTTQMIAMEMELEEMKSFVKKAHSGNEKAVQEMQAACTMIENLRLERDTATKRFELERKSKKVWTETEKQLHGDKLLLSGNEGALEQFLNLLLKQGKVYENRTDYEPEWQEMIINDMNECLRALYRSQREVEAKREHFIDSLCLPSRKESSGVGSQATATAIVS